MKFNLKEHTILWTIGGSRAYGMHTSESDVDTKGICIPPSRFYHGTAEHFEQVEGSSHLDEFRHLLSPEERRVAATTKLEGVIYEIRKFMQLATACNPNILDVLFCRDHEVRLITPLGKLLRENRNLFISARAKHSYSGFAVSQLRRMENDRGNKTVKTGRGSNRADLTARHGYDTKYAAHLVRLLRMAHEILCNGEVNVWRHDAEELIAIRRGEWRYEAVVAWAKEQDKALTALYEAGRYAVPHSPDREAISDLCCKIVERGFREAGSGA